MMVMMMMMMMMIQGQDNVTFAYLYQKAGRQKGVLLRNAKCFNRVNAILLQCTKPSSMAMRFCYLVHLRWHHHMHGAIGVGLQLTEKRYNQPIYVLFLYTCKQNMPTRSIFSLFFYIQIRLKKSKFRLLAVFNTMC